MFRLPLAPPKTKKKVRSCNSSQEETPNFLEDFAEQCKMDPYANRDDGDEDLGFEMELLELDRKKKKAVSAKTARKEKPERL